MSRHPFNKIYSPHNCISRPTNRIRKKVKHIWSNKQYYQRRKPRIRIRPTYGGNLCRPERREKDISRPNIPPFLFRFSPQINTWFLPSSLQSRGKTTQLLQALTGSKSRGCGSISIAEIFPVRPSLTSSHTVLVRHHSCSMIQNHHVRWIKKDKNSVSDPAKLYGSGSETMDKNLETHTHSPIFFASLLGLSWNHKD